MYTKREIKFRAWNGGKLYQQAGITPDGGVLLIGEDVGVAQAFGEAVLLLQFTGLTDKNGKEIYEGDILQVNLIPTPDRRVVEFGEACWNVVLPANKNEVIGNIYENPELLES